LHLVLVSSVRNYRVLENLFGLPVGSASRIKTSWSRTYDYITDQSTLTLDDICNQLDARNYTDPSRCPDRPTAAINELHTISLSAYFDGATMRRSWKWSSLSHVQVQPKDIFFLDESELYVSVSVHDEGLEYFGQLGAAIVTVIV
jgi:hypothetical protein